MKIVYYSIIILILISFSITVNSGTIIANSDHQSNIKNKPMLSRFHTDFKTTNSSLTMLINLNLYTNNTNMTTSKTIYLGVSSVVTVSYFYIVFYTQYIWNMFYGFGVAHLNFTYEGITQYVDLSSNDFISDQGNFKQIIIAYQNITINPTNKLTLNVTMDITSYLISHYDFNLYIKSIDLFFIEYPLVDPVVIPTWQYGEISTQGNNLLINANTLDYTIFLPSHNDVNVSIMTTAPIVVKDIEIDHALWVNIPNLTLPSKNFTLSFVTADSSSMEARILTLYYAATTNLPLIITITGEVVIFKITKPMAILTSDQTNTLFVIATCFTVIPLGNLLKNRRKKLKNIKL